MPEESFVCRHVTPEYELVITYPSDMLEESVIYQDIFQKGKQQGVEQGERRVALCQLERRFGKLPPGVRGQIAGLAVTQLEELCEALLDFQTRSEMLAWFKQQAAKG